MNLPGTPHLKNLTINKNLIKFSYQNKNYELKKNQVNPQIKTLLPSIYRHKLKNVEIENSLKLREAIMLLIDLYYLEDSIILDKFINLITARISRGVNKLFLQKLKIVYATIGHILKQYNYL